MQNVIERKQIKNIDFNCDLAQSFGIYKNSKEYDLLDYASSVNISCGFHAGDPLAIKEALLAAKERNIVIGAHIGYNDIQGFGYKPMDLDESELEALVMYQVGALMTFAKAYNMEIEHVRPHGAMYRKASEDFETSRINVALATRFLSASKNTRSHGTFPGQAVICLVIVAVALFPDHVQAWENPFPSGLVP